MIVPSQLALKTHTNFGCAASLATLFKLVDRFPLPPVSPPIGNTNLTHVMTEACGTFNYATNAYCDGTIIYIDPFGSFDIFKSNAVLKKNQLTTLIFL
jgi:hypothetical protein